MVETAKNKGHPGWPLWSWVDLNRLSNGCRRERLVLGQALISRRRVSSPRLRITASMAQDLGAGGGELVLARRVDAEGEVRYRHLEVLHRPFHAGASRIWSSGLATKRVQSSSSATSMYLG